MGAEAPMILIGMYDSPFVRRVAIAMRLYGMAFEHRPWSVFRDADKVAEHNPLIRVPTLVLDDGEALIDSAAILDALDDMAGRDHALIPASGPARQHAMQVCALACGLGDKVVSLIYERAVHGRETPDWVARCNRQIAGALDALEDSRGDRAWWFGAPSIGHADIAVATVLTLAVEALGFDLDSKRWARLAAHRERCEARAEFAEIHQAFFAPPPKA
jgi:glutathione S-transferase